MSPLDCTRCVYVPEQLCWVFSPCSTVHQHPPAAFRLSFRVQDSRTAGVARLRDFAVITESSATVASENLWSVDFRPGSAHNDGLFMTLSEVWSGINMKCFILKWTGCFNVVSRSICSVLNCCVVLHHLAKVSLAYLLQRASDHCSCYGVETQHSRSQWKHKRLPDLKLISSAAIVEPRCTAHASGGIQGWVLGEGGDRCTGHQHCTGADRIGRKTFFSYRSEFFPWKINNCWVAGWI